MKKIPNNFYVFAESKDNRKTEGNVCGGGHVWAE